MCNREREHELTIEIEELESNAEHTKTQMKALFESVCKDIKRNQTAKFSADEVFTIAARACSIVGISIEKQKEIEVKVED